MNYVDVKQGYLLFMKNEIKELLLEAEILKFMIIAYARGVLSDEEFEDLFNKNISLSERK